MGLGVKLNFIEAMKIKTSTTLTEIKLHVV